MPGPHPPCPPGQWLRLSQWSQLVGWKGLSTRRGTGGVQGGEATWAPTCPLHLHLAAALWVLLSFPILRLGGLPGRSRWEQRAPRHSPDPSSQEKVASGSCYWQLVKGRINGVGGTDRAQSSSGPGTWWDPVSHGTPTLFSAGPGGNLQTGLELALCPDDHSAHQVWSIYDLPAVLSMGEHLLPHCFPSHKTDSSTQCLHCPHRQDSLPPPPKDLSLLLPHTE